MQARWAVSDLSFEMDDDQTDDPIVTIVVHAPGATLQIIAEIILDRSIRSMTLSGTHIHGATANLVGGANLRTVAQAVMRGMHLDEIVVEGGIRTTGANPGRRPRPFRFTR